MIQSNGNHSGEDTLASLNRLLGEIQLSHNASPDPEMGGLSPNEVDRLVRFPWDEPGSIVHVNRAISLNQANASPFLRNTRAFLLKLKETGGVKPTAAGNLPRAFVAEMIDSFLDAHGKEKLFGLSKVVNEHDLCDLHIARVVCEVAGMTGRFKGKYRLKKRYEALLAPESAGELAAHLFLCYFRKFNLSYRVPIRVEAPGLQQCLGYTLYRLSRVGKDWLSSEEFAEKTILPGVRDQIVREIDDLSYWTVPRVVHSRIVVPLVDWGLLDERKEDPLRADGSVRITPFFQSFLRFEFDPRDQP